MLVSGGMGLMMLTYYGGDYGMMNGFGGMMGGYAGMMGNFGITSAMTGFMLIGLISGLLVIISAIMLSNNPSRHLTWATLILVFSIISLFGMGGFFVGALLGIIGGAFGLAWRPAKNV